MTVAYKDFFEITKQKIFDDIFNYSEIILKNNVRLSILNNSVAVRNMVYNSLITAMMPDNKHYYYLFMCDNIVVSNLLFRATSWMNLEDVLNEHKINLDFVTGDNKLIPKQLIWGHIDKSGMVIFAVNRLAYDKLQSTTETYLVINADTDNVGERTVISHIPVLHENINNVLVEFNNHEDKFKLGFINGYAYRNDVFQTAGDRINDHYELYIDENVRFSFVVDLAHRKIYNSSEENLYKDIILIPRELNGDKVCTYDTISLIVRTYEGKGIYLPFIASDSVSQLTHTCFSVSSYLIDAALDKLEVTSGEILVIVSDYSKTNTNVDNGSITEEMYKLTDDEIISIISSETDHEISYWQANNLEKRVYGKYLTNVDEMDNYDQVLIKKQIECLGYYPFVNTLCSHNGEFHNLDNDISNLTIQKPAYWKGVDLYPILYLDGNKINNDRYSISQDDNAVYVNFDLPLVIDFVYSFISYELMLAPFVCTYRCTANSNFAGISVPKHNGSLHVFHKTDSLIKNIDGTSYSGYEELYIENNVYYTVTETDTEYVFVFKLYAYGQEFVFTDDMSTVINNHPNIDITEGKTLYFIPHSDEANILTEDEYEIYLNGRYMVKDIDYRIKSLVGNDTSIAGFSIVIQNLKFLNETGANSVEIFKSNRKVISSDVGYVVDGIIPRNINNEAWIKGVSRLFINGKIVPFDAVTEMTTHYEVDPKYCGNGYIYCFINSISNDFYKAYEAFMNLEYFPGRKEIVSFFTRDYHYEYPDQVIIQYGNRIFSSYLNEIIRRIVNDEITVNFINDDNDIINQLVNYDYLKDFDVIFTSDKIDKRFIDVYPGYLATVSITDLNKYRYIQRLVKIVLGNDAVTDHMTVYSG
jgi:predicted DNA-binding protein YlxM (UPF0122 family)